MDANILALCGWPFAGALWLFFAGNRVSAKTCAVFTAAATIFSGLQAWRLCQTLLTTGKNDIVAFWGPFLHVELLTIDLALRVDMLTAIMSIMVLAVSLLVQIYAAGYFHHENRVAVFYSYVLAFTGLMLVLICADSLPILFLGWEGVGLCSYALIGFAFTEPDNTAKARRALLINRCGGDACLLAAMAILWHYGGTLQLAELATHIHLLPQAAATAAAALVMIAIASKSAQLPLHVWLPEAMCGPTPASALIHAATMVTAGVYLACRLQSLFAAAPIITTYLTVLGTLTALIAACWACRQDDVKKVLAYSTISQLGYMIVACGLQAPDLAFFHLLTHACFKACLFLIAGRCIHAAAGEQHLGKINKLGPQNRLVTASALMAVASMTGWVGLGGFVSKDAILAHIFAIASGAEATKVPLIVAQLTWLMITATGLLTSFYMWRWFFLIFSGEPTAVKSLPGRSQKLDCWLMDGPILSLALASVFIGILNWPPELKGDMWLSRQLVNSLEITPPSNYLGLLLMGLNTIIALLGWWTAYTYYSNGRGTQYVLTTDSQSISLMGIYTQLIARPYAYISHWVFDVGCEQILLRGFDIGLTFVVAVLGFCGQILQNGRIQQVLSLAITVLTGWLYWSRS